MWHIGQNSIEGQLKTALTLLIRSKRKITFGLIMKVHQHLFFIAQPLTKICQSTYSM